MMRLEIVDGGIEKALRHPEGQFELQNVDDHSSPFSAPSLPFAKEESKTSKTPPHK